MDYWIGLGLGVLLFAGGTVLGMAIRSYLNTAKPEKKVEEETTPLVIADLGDLRVFDVIMAHGQPYKCVEMSSRHGGDYATEYEIILRSL